MWKYDLERKIPSTEFREPQGKFSSEMVEAVRIMLHLHARLVPKVRDTLLKLVLLKLSLSLSLQTNTGTRHSLFSPCKDSSFENAHHLDHATPLGCRGRKFLIEGERTYESCLKKISAILINFFLSSRIWLFYHDKLHPRTCYIR